MVIDKRKELAVLISKQLKIDFNITSLNKEIQRSKERIQFWLKFAGDLPKNEIEILKPSIKIILTDLKFDIKNNLNEIKKNKKKINKILKEIKK